MLGTGLNEYLRTAVRDEAGLFLPESWRIARFGNIAQIVSKRGPLNLELLSVYLGRGVIRYTEGGKRVHAPSADLRSYQEVRRGNLVMNNQQAWRGSVGVSRLEGIVSPAYLVFDIVNELRPRYAELLFTAPFMVDQYVLASKGVGDIQRTIYEPYLRTCLVPLPPAEEQAAIVKYLAHAHARIDRTIAAKRNLVALLEEQMQAVIQQAVTRGLDPRVPLKDSGVSWLGEIPAHWESRRAGTLFREVVVKSASGEEEPLSMSQKLGLVPSSQVDRSLGSESMAGGKLCKANDLVLNRLKAHLGVFAIARQPGVISPDYTVLRPGPAADSTYFEHVLKSPAVRSELFVRAKGIVEGFWRLYTNDFNTIVVPCPPLGEQQMINTYIAEVVREVKDSVARAIREVELLQEFRTRLTSDVVSGQVDVREIAATLPELGDDERTSRAAANFGYEDIAEPEPEFSGTDE